MVLPCLCRQLIYWQGGKYIQTLPDALAWQLLDEVNKGRHDDCHHSISITKYSEGPLLTVYHFSYNKNCMLRTTEKSVRSDAPLDSRHKESTHGQTLSCLERQREGCSTWFDFDIVRSHFWDMVQPKFPHFHSEEPEALQWFWRSSFLSTQLKLRSNHVPKSRSNHVSLLKSTHVHIWGRTMPYFPKGIVLQTSESTFYACARKFTVIDFPSINAR